jgi:hypothetical protein
VHTIILQVNTSQGNRLQRLKIFVMFFILLACIDRCIFLTVDPWGFNSKFLQTSQISMVNIGKIPPFVASILYEVGIGAIVTSYSLLIAYW